MEKYGMVESIMKLYDRIEQLETELKFERMCTEMALDIKGGNIGDGKTDDEDRRMLDYLVEQGMKKVVHDATNYWTNVRIDNDAEEKGTVETYEQWTSRCVDNVPSCVSKDKLIKACEKELRRIYEEEKEETLERYWKAEKADED